MKRFLHTILALSILVTQSAWAIHIDELEGGASDQTYTQPVEHDDDVADACNHFCHASAHLVGLFTDNIIELHASRDSHVALLKNVSDSYNDQPSIPPPIS